MATPTTGRRGTGSCAHDLRDQLNPVVVNVALHELRLKHLEEGQQP
jgi:hypothetical protein